MDLAVELVDLHCLAEVAGLAVPRPRLAKEVALADFQRCVEEAGLAGSQRFCGGGWIGCPNALWRGLDWLALQWWLSSCWLSRTGFPTSVEYA
jgi:hypothetical protein